MRTHRFIKISAVVVLVAAIGVGAALQLHSHNKPAKETSQKSGHKSDKVNLSPPTKDQSNAAGIHHNSNGSSSGQQNPTQKKQVTPVITSWGRSGDKLDVSGYVQGVVEDGGTCKFELKMGSTVKTVTTTGIFNASTTSCGQAAFNYGALGKGVWQAYLIYSSTTAQGISSPVSVEVK